MKILINDLASEKAQKQVSARNFLFMLKNLLVIGKEEFLAAKEREVLWKRVLADFDSDHKKNIYDLSAFSYLFYESINKLFGLTGKEECVFLNRQRLEYYEENFLTSLNVKERSTTLGTLQHDRIKDEFASLAAKYDKSFYQTMGFYYFFYNSATLRSILDPVYLSFYRKFFQANYELFLISHRIEVLIQYVLCNADVSEYLWLIEKVSKDLAEVIAQGGKNIIPKAPRQFERSEIMEYHLSLSKDAQPFLKPLPHDVYLKNITDFFWIASRKFAFFQQDLLIKISDFLCKNADELSVLDKINVFYAKTVLYCGLKDKPVGQALRDSAQRFFRKLEPQLEQHIQSSFPNSKPNCLLYQSIVFWGLDQEVCKGEFSARLSSAQLMESLERNWKEVSLKKINGSYTEKTLGAKIEKIFNSMSLNTIQKNALVGIYSVDLLLPPKTVIEINGDAHYSYKEQDGKAKELCLNGNYLMKLEILKMMGYEIRLLNTNEFISLLGKEQALEEHLKRAIFEAK